ncbi:MAG TPA: PDZ domain-containing protein [Candidatus Binataceae bacterium]|nr:PDZ domain-containing protein [Candidatus Binataceae bacterium]
MKTGRGLAISLIVLALSIEGNSVAWTAGGVTNAPADPVSQSSNGSQPIPSNDAKAHGALEISPQINAVPANPSPPPSEQPAAPGDQTASYEQYQGGAPPAPKPPEKSPYLGFVVEDTVKSYGGQEEHGLEIVTIDPDSPAEHAGLKGRGAITPLGAAGVTAGALLGPLSMAVIPLLNKNGQLGKDGDLIIAVDDRRVHSEFDFRDELGRLKPGDTIYLTVVRATAQGGRQTLKLPVKVGAQSSEDAINAPPFDPYSAQSPY